MSTRINTKFALTLFLAATLVGGVGGGLWWWKHHKTAAAREARGDREAALASALFDAGDTVGADNAYVRACNQYGLALQQDLSNRSALEKYRNLTLQLATPTYGDAYAWIQQHNIACRHEALTSQDPGVLSRYYSHMLLLADESQELGLYIGLIDTADNDFKARPGHTASQLYRGVMRLKALVHPKVVMAAKDKRAWLALAKADLEDACKADPNNPVGARHLGLLRMQEILVLPEAQRLGPVAQRLAAEAASILEKARAAHPADPKLAVMAAQVAVFCAPISGQPAAPLVRSAVALVRNRQAPVEPLDLQLLCHLACISLTDPGTANEPGRTEGQQQAIHLAAQAVAASPKSTLCLLALGSAQSFAGDYESSNKTFHKALAPGSRLTVAERMVFEANRPLLLYLQARDQLSMAHMRQGKESDQLRADAQSNINLLKNHPDFAPKCLVLEAQKLFMGGHYEKAAGSFDQSMRTDIRQIMQGSANDALVTPALLHAAAISHLRCGNMGASVELLNAALTLDASRAEDHLLLAKILMDMGCAEETVAAHLRGMKGPAMTELSGELAMRHGRFRDAEQAFRSLDPLVGLPKLADALHAMGSYEAARAEAMAMLRRTPVSAQRTYVACLALPPEERAAALREATAAGLLPDEAQRIKAALADFAKSKSPLDEIGLPINLPLEAASNPSAKDAAAAWAKRDWAAFENASKTVPHHPEILGHRIELAVLRRDWAGARKLAEYAKTNNIELAIGSGPALDASISAMEAMESGQSDLLKTIDNLRAAAIASPASIGLWDLLTAVLLAADRPGEAAKCAEYTCRLQPQKADRLYMLMQCRLRIGHTADILQDLRRRSESMPLNDDLREVWLNAEEALGDLAVTEEARAARRRQAPGDLSNMLRLAALLHRTGRPAEARTVLMEASLLAAGHPQAAMELAAALGKAGFAVEGCALLKQTLRAIPGIPPSQVSLLLAQVSMHLGDPAAEAAAWQTALNQESRDSRQASCAYAARLMDSNRMPEAVAFLRDLSGKIPAAHPLRPQLMAMLANALGAAGKYGEVEEIAKELPELEALLLRANVAMVLQNDAELLRLARQTTAVAPENPTAWILLCQALATDPLREQEAREAIRHALILSPSNAGARHMEAVLDAQNGHYRTAVNRLWRNLAFNPGHGKSVALLNGLLFVDKGRTGGQNTQQNRRDLDYLRVAVRAEMQRWRETRGLGTFSLQDSPDNLVTAFQSQVFRQADGPMNMTTLASILIETNRPDQAMLMLEHLSPDSLKNPPIQAMRALAMHKNGRHPEAEAAFRETFLSCTGVDALNECLRNAAMASTPQEALKKARDAWGANPPVFVLLGLGVSAMRMDLPQEAIATLNQLLKQPGTTLDSATLARAYGTLGVAEERLGHDESAVAHYRKAVSSDPNDLVSLNNLANMLLLQPVLALGADEALNMARRASFNASRAAGMGDIPLHDLAGIRDTLGLACERQGRKKEAMAIYTAVLDIFQLPESHLHLGLLLEAEKKSAPALKHYEEAASLADHCGQPRLAAEARWRADPGSFRNNVTYAALLAENSRDSAVTMARKCVEMAGHSTPPPNDLALLMRLCRNVWPEPAAGKRVPEGLQISGDLAAAAVAAHSQQSGYHLLSAIAQEWLGQPTWENELEAALAGFSISEGTTARWEPSMPKGFPLPDISANAACRRMPPTPWALTHDKLRDALSLIAIAPESPSVARILKMAEAQLQYQHANVLKAIGSNPASASERRLAAVSLTATGDFRGAADMLETLIASGQATTADRVRHLGLCQQLGLSPERIAALAEDALRLDATCFAAKETLGDVRLAKRDYATATALYANIPLNAAPAVAVKNALALHELGREQEARNALLGGFAANPKDPWILDALLQSELGESARQSHFERAIAKGMNPDLVSAFEKKWHLKMPRMDSRLNTSLNSPKMQAN